MPRKNETKVPKKIIDKVIKRHLEGGEGVAELAAELGLSRATFYNWIDRYRRDLLEQSETAGMSPTAIEKKNVAALQAENKFLKAELERTRNRLVAALIKSGDI